MSKRGADKADLPEGLSKNPRNSEFFLQNVHALPSEVLKAAQVQRQQGIKLQLHGTEKPLTSLKPKQIQQALDKLVVNSPKMELTFTREGDLNLSTDSYELQERVLKLKKIVDCKVSVRILQTSVTNTIVINMVPTDLSLMEIGEELTRNGVHWTYLSRFTKKMESGVVPLHMIKIQEVAPTFRDHIYLWYFRYPASPYTERPRQCTKCQGFNHTAQTCRRTTVCANCAENHNSETCTDDKLRCRNCNDAHSASTKTCPAYIRECAIIREKRLRRLSYFEASKIVGPVKKKTFAQTAGNSHPDNVIQTLQKNQERIELQLTLNNNLLKEILKIFQQKTTLTKNPTSTARATNPSQDGSESSPMDTQTQEFSANGPKGWSGKT